MAIECFVIEWSKLYLFDKALLQPEVKNGGVYALFKATVKKPYYIGKATNFENRLKTHRQSMFRMWSETERKNCRICFGIITSFEMSGLSTNITETQLGSVENYFITKIQPIGNGDATKKRYTGKFPVVIINKGNLFYGLDKFMSQNPELLKALGKSVTKRKPSSDSWPF